MVKKVLVAYATRFGSSVKVAEQIGQSLRSKDLKVDVYPMIMITSTKIKEYDMIIIGGPIYGGRWYHEIEDFILINKFVLTQKKVAYYVVCLTMRNDTPQNRLKVLNYIRPVLNKSKGITPLSIGLFAGSSENVPVHLKVQVTITGKGLPKNYMDNESVEKWIEELPMRN